MGKLLIGRYGRKPEATSVSITLRECNQRLGVKPSDYLGQEEPDIFNNDYGAMGRYIVLEVGNEDLDGNAIWKPGFYLLTVQAREAARRLYGMNVEDRAAAKPKPVHIESKDDPPEIIRQRALLWAEKSQPLFFECRCEELVLKLDSPWSLRNSWKAKLRCPRKCQPPFTTEL